MKRLNYFALIAGLSSFTDFTLNQSGIEKAPTIFYKSSGKGGKVPTRTGHKHMAYVRQQRKRKTK